MYVYINTTVCGFPRTHILIIIITIVITIIYMYRPTTAKTNLSTKTHRGGAKSTLQTVDEKLGVNYYRGRCGPYRWYSENDIGGMKTFAERR